MAITGVEPIINAVVERLVENINGYIDTINVEATDGITLDYPTEIFNFPPPRSMITECPVIAVVEGDFKIEDDTGWGGTGRLDVVLVHYHTDYDPGALAARLRRMDRAIIQCMMADRTLGNEGWGLNFVGSEAGPTLARKETPREMFSLRACSFNIRFEQDQ